MYYNLYITGKSFFPETVKSHAALHQNIFMTLRPKCCLVAIAASWVEPHLCFSALNVAIGGELNVRMQHTKHNHLEVNKKKICFFFFVGSVSLKSRLLKVRSVGKNISHVYSAIA